MAGSGGHSWSMESWLLYAETSNREGPQRAPRLGDVSIRLRREYRCDLCRTPFRSPNDEADVDPDHRGAEGVQTVRARSTMIGDATPTRGEATLAILRGVLLAILTVGLAGMLVELVLLEHTEEAWQRLPIFMLTASLIILAWHALTRDALSVRAVQTVMALFILTGVIGVALHFKGNVEFELETQPSASGSGLLWATLTGATPTLAPGAMVQLGLLGLAYAFRHPALRQRHR